MTTMRRAAAFGFVIVLGLAGFGAVFAQEPPPEPPPAPEPAPEPKPDEPEAPPPEPAPEPAQAPEPKEEEAPPPEPAKETPPAQAPAPATPPAAAPAAAPYKVPPDFTKPATIWGDVLVGVTGQDEDPTDSAKFGEYRDVPSGLTADRLFLSWIPKEGYHFDLRAIDLSQDDQRIDSEFGKQDLWSATILWYENPRRWTDQADQLYARQGGNVFTLDDTLQSAVQAAPANVDANADGEWDAGTKGALIKGAINNSAQAVDVGWHRRTGGVGFELTPSRHWTFNAGAARERRSGAYAQSLGMTFSLAPSEVSSSLDYKTDWETVGAEYHHRRFNAGVQLLASQFETAFNNITWDDQLFLNDVAVNANSANPARGRLTTSADNKMMQAMVYGGVNLPARTRIDVTLSRSETTQDDPFLPMTTNTLLNPAALPAASYDGKYDINLASLRVSGRPTTNFRWSAWARDWEYDNGAEALTFADYVTTDASFPLCGNANACGATTNRLSRRSLPYGWERINVGGSAGLRATSWLDGALSYDRETMKREHSAVTESNQDTLKLALDFDVSDWLTIRTTTRRMERRADEYDAEYNLEAYPIGEAYIAPSNEGMRRFIWTDRDRDQVDVLFDVTVSQAVSIYAETTYARDVYFDPNTGLEVGDSYNVQEDRNFDTIPEDINLLIAGRTDDKFQSYTLGAGFNPSPRFNLYADYTWEKSTYGLETRYRAPVAGIGSDDPLDNWGTDTDDRYQTATLAFTANLTGDGRWRVMVDTSWSEGTGTIQNHFVPGGQASSDTTLLEFPELKTTLVIAQASLMHTIRKNLDWSVRYWYEDWDEENFASDFSQPYMGDPGNDPGSSNAIFLGLDFADYTNHLMTFLLHYRY